MNKVALRQAWERLHKAETALKAIRDSNSIHHIASAWTDFLSASATIFSKLEKGTKGNNRAEPWFGRIKSERKTDELLRYIHHARNSDEHGIAEVVQKSMGFWAIKGDVHIERLETDGNGNVKIGKIRGLNPQRPPELVLEPATVKLLPVHDDRFNDTFDPPTSHLGVKLESGSLLEVAEKSYVYMHRILKEAGKFVEA